ncbi:unnamed protein product, partial [marine sediment metagenome]
MNDRTPADYRKANIVLALIAIGIASIVLLCIFSESKYQCTVPEVEWTEEEPLRNVPNLGKVLSDIESHMPKGHIYSDPDRITWGHETTHGIHGRLRQKYSKAYAYKIDRSMRGRSVCISLDGTNCFYVLKNRV